mmetsp:Transcript_12691/g.23174  ORF Transcript_12691/g.23174 Transcript_12691/m.23174 type:complete len:321 (+) Transcript_12691:1275-2237(+)
MGAGAPRGHGQAREQGDGVDGGGGGGQGSREGALHSPDELQQAEIVRPEQGKGGAAHEGRRQEEATAQRPMRRGQRQGRGVEEEVPVRRDQAAQELRVHVRADHVHGHRRHHQVSPALEHQHAAQEAPQPVLPDPGHHHREQGRDRGRGEENDEGARIAVEQRGRHQNQGEEHGGPVEEPQQRESDEALQEWPGGEDFSKEQEEDADAGLPGLGAILALAQGPQGGLRAQVHHDQARTRLEEVVPRDEGRAREEGVRRDEERKGQGSHGAEDDIAEAQGEADSVPVLPGVLRRGAQQQRGLRVPPRRVQGQLPEDVPRVQ